MSVSLRSLVALCGIFLASCSSAPAPCPDTQAVVDSLARQHANVTRLSVHAVPPGGGDFCAIASTSDEKRGTKSDPEDLKAIQTGETVIRDENGSIDVTVPILMVEGKYTASAGVTLNSGVAQDAALAEAKSIAAEIAAAMVANKSKM